MKVDREQAERLHRFAHDLRNRLIGLHQVVERSRDDLSKEEREEFIHFGEQQYFKALREVESVMDDLGVERGVPVLAPEPIILSDLLSTRISNLQYRFDRKDQRVKVDMDPSIRVIGDPRVIGDLLDALLSNASKFSHSGGPIDVRVERDGQMAVITVSDTGTGLSPADLEQVFVRFAWLGNRPTAGEAQGRSTLARAREWALAHGGSLNATSEGEGHGCTFTLRLPLAD